MSLILSLALLLAPGPAAAETLVTVSGRVYQQAVDYPDNTAEIVHYLETKSGRTIRLDLTGLPSLRAQTLGTGAVASLAGSFTAAGDIFRVTAIKSFVAAPAVADNASVGGLVTSGSRRAVIIKLNMKQNNVTYASEPCSTATISDQMYDNAQSMRRIYEVSSRSQLTFNSDADANGSVDAFGPFTINGTPGSCDFASWATQADAAATAAGVVLSLYQHKFYVMPNYDQIGCPWYGRADYACGNSCRVWIAYCANISVYTHEVGHNFGMWHAGTDSNNDGVVEDEYGDTSCPMGYVTLNTNLFNAPHQDQLGWFDANPGKMLTVSTNGSYTLAPLERDSGATPYAQMIKIHAGNNDNFYLSYRRREAPIDKVPVAYADKINVHRFRNGSVEPTRLLKVLDDGQSFTDPTIGFTATMTAHDADSASVSITFPSDAADADNDGVSDYREGQDGTKSSDAGSYLNHLTSPVYLLWNGFLGMVNIAELINPSADPNATTSITLSLYSISGELMHTQPLSLSGGQQFDLILNGLPGFTADSYGIVKLEYTGSLDGRVSYYRPRGTEYEFAYSIPLNQPVRGTTGVGFNTFQPSTKAAEAQYSVFNWLTLVNLSGTAQNFTVNSYNQVGVKLATRVLSVAPFGRADVDGGHALAGPGVVGLHEIIPANNTTPYIAQLIRYGANSGPGQAPSGYFFAFPLTAHAGNGEPIMLPTSRQFGEANWVEVANMKSTTVNVNIRFFTVDGTVQSTDFALAPHAQSHFFVDDARLAASTRGFVRIDSDTPNSVVAQSMFYYRDSAGSIKAMYGVEPREAIGSQYSGSYNLFLGMQNWLAISSVSNQWVVATVQTIGPGGGSTQNFSIGPYKTIYLPIHDASQFHTVTDSYGFLRVTPDRSNSIVADLVRYRRLGADFDFAFPTAVRP